jgi:hypothetical protein
VGLVIYRTAFVLGFWLAMTSTAALADGDRAPAPSANGGPSGGAERLLLPQFSGGSGDFSLYQKPSIGTLRVDEQGRADSGFYLGTLSNRRTMPAHPQDARLGERTDETAWDVGAVFGYQVNGLDDPRTAAGVNLQVVTDMANPRSRLLLQPGVDYTMPFGDQVHLKTRLFSTYAAEDSDRLTGETRNPSTTSSRFDGEGGWREVGVNFGVGYNVTDSWTIETQAGFTRGIGNAAADERASDQGYVSDIFGGVFLNYKF